MKKLLITMLITFIAVTLFSQAPFGLSPADYVTMRVSDSEVNSRYTKLMTPQSPAGMLPWMIYAGFINCEDIAKPTDKISVVFFWQDGKNRLLVVATTTMKIMKIVSDNQFNVPEFINNRNLVTLESVPAN